MCVGKCLTMWSMVYLLSLLLLLPPSPSLLLPTPPPPPLLLLLIFFDLLHLIVRYSCVNDAVLYVNFTLSFQFIPFLYISFFFCFPFHKSTNTSVSSVRRRRNCCCCCRSRCRSLHTLHLNELMHLCVLLIKIRIFFIFLHAFSFVSSLNLTRCVLAFAYLHIFLPMFNKWKINKWKWKWFLMLLICISFILLFIRLCACVCVLTDSWPGKYLREV